MTHDPTPKVPTLPVVTASGFSPIPLPLKPGIHRLRKNGCDIDVVSFRLSDMRDVQTFAGHIAEAVRTTAARSPTGRANLVGLSMGGVAGYYAIVHMGIGHLVDTFVAVGAPFHGSRMSWLALPTGTFTRTGRQLLPGSRFLKKLRRARLPADIRFVTVAGVRDLICPASTALLENSEQVMADFDHQDIFRTHWVQDLFVSLCR